MHKNAPMLTEDFLRRYDVPGPRYTSYPPAPHFTKEFDPMEVRGLIEGSNRRGRRELSFYVHVPFCPRQCSYCGCTTEIGRPGSEVRDYFEAVALEMERILPLLDASRPVTQIHFGGGTPNGVPFHYLHEIVDRIRSRFPIADAAEIAIECDPNLLTLRKLAELRTIGFNRVSFGLQDFDKAVLDAVNRGYPRIEPVDLVSEARRLGFRGINLDLIYGLPKQTPESFSATVRRCIEAGPDRVATFSYAHVPWAKEHQKILEERGLPSPDAKLAMAVETYNTFQASGYRAIGMDHFARPDDDLALAQEHGLLHRNFQGYCSRRTTGQVVGLGASAIGQFHDGYVQNIHDSAGFIRAVRAGGLPVERAYFASREDRFRRDVINSLMCAGELDPDTVGEGEGLSREEVDERLASGFAKLAPFEEDNLLERVGKRIRVTPRGRLAVRNVAMLFDPLLDTGAGRYSRTV